MTDPRDLRALAAETWIGEEAGHGSMRIDFEVYVSILADFAARVRDEALKEQGDKLTETANTLIRGQRDTLEAALASVREERDKAIALAKPFVEDDHWTRVRTSQTSPLRNGHMDSPEICPSPDCQLVRSLAAPKG